MRAALRTGPRPVTKTQMFIDILTYRTGSAARIETIHLTQLAVVLCCRILEFLHERAEGQVCHLAAPQTGHTRQLQVLNTESIIGTAKFVCKFPLPVVTTVRDVLVDTFKGSDRRTAEITGELVKLRGKIIRDFRAFCSRDSQRFDPADSLRTSAAFTYRIRPGILPAPFHLKQRQKAASAYAEATFLYYDV